MPFKTDLTVGIKSLRKGMGDLIYALASGSDGSGRSVDFLTGKARRRGASTADARRKLAGTALQSSKSTRITRGRERGLRRISPEHSRATGRRGDGGRRRSEAAEVARRGGRWCAVGTARSHVKWTPAGAANVGVASNPFGGARSDGSSELRGVGYGG